MVQRDGLHHVKAPIVEFTIGVLIPVMAVGLCLVGDAVARRRNLRDMKSLNLALAASTGIAFLMMVVGMLRGAGF